MHLKPETSSNEPLRRVWIVGPCGAGKSTFGKQLAAQLGVGYTSIDDLYWKPGWEGSGDEELVGRIEPIVRGDGWVIDGNYDRIQARYRDRVQLYVWLDLPFHTTLRRLIGRCLARSFDQQPICNGNRETLRQSFMSRNSIILYGIQTWGRKHRKYSRLMPALPHVRLRNERQVAALLGSFKTSAGGRLTCAAGSGPARTAASTPATAQCW